MSEGALTVLQVILVMANVRRTVRPLHFTHAVLLTVLPLAIVRASVSVFAPTLPVHLVVTELSCVDDSDAGPVCAQAVLFAMTELTFIPGTVGPVLDTAAPLFILVPLALKGAAINLGVPPKAVHTVLVPLPVVRVAVCRQEHAVPVGPTVGEGALVALAIRPLRPAPAAPPAACRRSVPAARRSLDNCYCTAASSLPRVPRRETSARTLGPIGRGHRAVRWRGSLCNRRCNAGPRTLQPALNCKKQYFEPKGL